MATKSASGRTKAQRDQDKRDQVWHRACRSYKPRPLSEHAARAGQIARGDALNDDDRLQLSLGAEPIDLIAALYAVSRGYVQSQRRKVPSCTRSSKPWRGADNVLGPGLNTSNTAVSIIRRGSR